MDPLTHYIFAYAIGRKMDLDNASLKALTFSALLPDIDVFTIVLGWDFVESFHGTLTHSIPVAIMLSLFLSMIFFIYSRKNVVLYCMIGISMHLLLDISMTLMPEWRDQGMILLYPFSHQKFALRNVVPYSFPIGSLVISVLFISALFLLYSFLKQKEYPWRLWIDERKIIKILRSRSNKRLKK